MKRINRAALVREVFILEGGKTLSGDGHKMTHRQVFNVVTLVLAMLGGLPMRGFTQAQCTRLCSQVYDGCASKRRLAIDAAINPPKRRKKKLPTPEEVIRNRPNFGKMRKVKKHANR